MPPGEECNTSNGSSSFTHYLVLMYRCGHCKRLAPTWDSLALQIHSTHNTVTIAKVESFIVLILYTISFSFKNIHQFCRVYYTATQVVNTDSSLLRCLAVLLCRLTARQSRSCAEPRVCMATRRWCCLREERGLRSIVEQERWKLWWSLLRSTAVTSTMTLGSCSMCWELNTIGLI